MKKTIFLSLVACLMAATISAQTPKKIRMDDGERMMGFYTTDELENFNTGGIGISPNDTYLIAALFDDDVIGNFVGGEIMRFRFAVAFAGQYVTRAFIIPCHTHNLQVATTPTIDDAIAVVDFSSQSVQAGWNDVELAEPVKIESDMWYLIGFEYVQSSGIYPLMSDRYLNPDITSDYGFLNYGDVMDMGFRYWVQMTGIGNLCVQAVVRGGNFGDYDISLNNIIANKYGAKGGTLPFSFDIMNTGNELPETYTLDVAVDGEVVDHIDTPIELTALYQTVSDTLRVATDLSSGRHTLTVSVSEIDGQSPSNTDNNVLEIEFVAYEGSVAQRQMHLIESFTSIGVNTCPTGDEVLSMLMENHPDKYACAEVHYDYGDDDPLAMADDDGDAHYLESYSNCMFYPSANFDRFIINDDDVNDSKLMAIYIGSYADNSVAAVQIDEVVEKMAAEVPALVSVDIDTSWDEATRQLTIRVSGSGVDDGDIVLADNRLIVYLTEDGLVSRQYTRSGWVDDYEHNGVLRLIANEYFWGDEIGWTTDSSYENTLMVKIADEWNVENMNVVAFISGAMTNVSGSSWTWAERSEGFLINANKVRVTDGSDGIARVATSDTEAKRPTGTYNLAGQRVTDTSLKGIYIKDGRKIIVK